MICGQIKFASQSVTTRVSLLKYYQYQTDKEIYRQEARQAYRHTHKQENTMTHKKQTRNQTDTQRNRQADTVQRECSSITSVWGRGRVAQFRLGCY